MNGLLLKVLGFFIAWLAFESVYAEDSYCFRFTWMGPSFTNVSFSSINETATCSDTYPAACRDPMIITEDGSPPDYQYIWANYPTEQIACRLSSGFVCAKWTNYYDESVEYVMHLCTKITVEDEGSMTSGCITSNENNSSRRTEVCACRSNPDFPCNSASYISQSGITIGILIMFFMGLAHI